MSKGFAKAADNWGGKNSGWGGRDPDGGRGTRKKGKSPISSTSYGGSHRGLKYLITGKDGKK